MNREQIALTWLLIMHTHLTQSFLLNENLTSICKHCKCIFMVSVRNMNTLELQQYTSLIPN